jgi:hypothetical protein
MKSIIAFTLLLFAIHSEVVIENPWGIMYPRGGDEDWGKGAYTIPDSIDLNLYHDTNENLYGSLRKDDFAIRLYDKKGSKMLSYPRRDIDWIGHYSCELLKFKECQNKDYVKVLWKHSPPGLFIKKSELKSLDIKPYNYREYLFSDDIPANAKTMRGGANIGVNLEKNCLNLREEPSLESQIIECIPGNDWWNGENSGEYNHLKILKNEGNWAKVKVTYYCIDESNKREWEEGCFGEVLRTSNGWVKAIDNNGFPNIWFSVTSY